MKHSLERCFASVVRIREVLRRGQHKFDFKESMRPNQTAKMYEGPVNPIALLLSNRQLRLRESKRAELHTRPFIPPQDDLWNAMPARPAAPYTGVAHGFFSAVTTLREIVRHSQHHTNVSPAGPRSGQRIKMPGNRQTPARHRRRSTGHSRSPNRHRQCAKRSSRLSLLVV